MGKKIAIIISFLTLLIMLLAVFISTKTHERSIFDIDRWNNNVPARIYMKDDLIRNYLPGISYSEVLELLGKEAISINVNDQMIEYVMGIDSRLVIYFDKNGVYEKYFIIP